MILAIDPGTENSAFVVFDQDNQTIINKGIYPNDAIFTVICNHHLADVWIEMVSSYGMPVGREVFETCVWIGRFIQAAQSKRNMPAKTICRRDVKLHLCGSVKAKDANIRQALIDLLGKEKTKGVSKDMWAALGVAVTVAGIQ